MSARNMAKRTAAGTLALAVCLGGGAIALASAANADANFKFERYAAGDTRFGTAVEASKKVFDKSEDVVLVNGWSTVDGLTASYLAGVKNAPILYTETDEAPQVTQDEIKRLGAKNVWIIGGEKVVSAKQETTIKAAGYNAVRIDGADRYETAANIAEAGAKVAGKPGKVFIASGEAWADALSVSTVSYGKKYPIILTEKDSTSKYSTDELGDLKVDTKIVVGGEANVSKSVYEKLSATERVYGADRAETANRVADWAVKSEGFNRSHVILVGGSRGADSMVASALGGKNGWNLHYAGWDATQTYLKDHAADLTGKGFVFGGEAAVSKGDIDKAQAAAQATVSTQSISVTTDGKPIATVSSEKTSEQNRGAVTYTIMTGAESVNIALFDASVVDTSGSSATFTSSAKTTATTEDVAIESVNGAVLISAGAGNAAQEVVVAKPVNGKIVFTVDARKAGQYVPVVWIDGKLGTAKSLDFAKSPSDASPQSPSDVFGVGQVQRWIPADSDGKIPANYSSEITFVNKAEKYFTTEEATFHYDDNDRFTVTDSTPRGLDYFEARLTKGDTIDIEEGGYAPTKAQVSSFALTNGAPVALAAPTIDEKDTSAVVTFDSTANTKELVKGASVKVYLQQLGGSTTADFDEASVATTVTKDADSEKDDFQIPLTGLKPNTEYALWITQVVDGEESEETALSTGSGEFTTLKDVASMSIKSISVADDVNDGENPKDALDPTKTVTATSLKIKLSGKVALNGTGDLTDADDIVIYPTNQPEKKIKVKAADTDIDGTDKDVINVTLTDGINDAKTDVEYTVEIASNQLTPSNDTTKVNAKLTGTFKH